MKTCIRCKQEVIADDLRNELSRQADALGMESLTEEEQLLVLGYICEDCFECT